MGLLIAACAGLAGASRVLVTDINPGRVAFAKEKGWATHTFVPPPPSGSRPMAIEDRLAASKAGTRDILEAIGSPDGVDFVYECTGVESCVQTGIYAARAGGTLILVGMGNPVMTLPISAAALREVDIKGGFRYANSYPLGIELLASGRLDPVAIESLVTNSFEGLKSVEDAFTMAGRQKDDDGNIVVKVEVTFSD